MKRLAVPSRWSSQMAIVSEISQDEIEQWMTGSERSWLRAIRSDRKRADSAAARAAVKLLAVELQLCSYPAQCEVVVTAGGPALQVNGSGGPLQLSLSHSEGYGAGGLAAGPIGIDIQVLREVDPRTARFFLNPGEEQRVPEREHRLLHLWCAKEAAWKASGAAGSTLTAVHFTGSRSLENGLAFSYCADDRRGTVETEISPEGLLMALAREITSLPTS